MRSKTGGRTRKVFERQVLDSDSGELIESESISVEVPIKGYEDFFMIFGANIRAIYKLSGAAKDVFIWASMNARVNRTGIALTRVQKEAISEETGLTVGTIDNAIQELAKKGILIRTGRGAYDINPHYAWKGQMNERAKAMKNMKLKVTFELEGDSDDD